MKLKLLFVLPCATDAARGNATTANRLASSLRQKKHTVAVCSLEELNKTQDHFDLVIACHASHTAPQVREWCIANSSSYLVLLTGTDLNGKPSPATTQAVNDAQHCISLGSGPARRAKDLFPDARQRITVIHQGVMPLPRASNTDLPDNFPTLSSDCELVLIPNGIRSIKNVKHSLDALVPLASERPQLVVCFAGSDFGGQYSAEFMEAISHHPWANYFEDLSSRELSAVIANSKLAISSSRSEGGAPNSLLECIAAGRPVIASDIAPHRELIGKQNCFRSDNEMRQLVRHVLDDQSHAIMLTRKLEEKVRFKHGANAEALSWERLLLSITAGRA